MSTVAVCGEIALWRSVVEQAFADATLGLSRDRAQKRIRVAEGKIEAGRMDDFRRAREWFTGLSRDFVQVCHLAMLDPAAVKASAEALMAECDRLFPWAIGSTDSPEPQAMMPMAA